MTGRVVCLVPARGGSQRLPGKNLMPVAGVSLVGRAVLTAREFIARAGLDADVVVDTDDPDISAEGRAWGADVPFLREPMLARVDTPTHTSVVALLERLAAAGRRYDTVVLLQPTSPLRTAADVAACWARYDPDARPSVASVSRVPPASYVRPLRDGGVLGAPAVADGTDSVCLTGAVYVSSVPALHTHGAFIVPDLTEAVVLSAQRSIDVDTAADLEEAEALARGIPIHSFAMAGRRIGPGAPCFLVAEAGINHNGDLELARRMIDVAAAAGTDAVKFQTFDPGLLAAPSAPKADYQQARTGIGESQHTMLQKLALSREQFRVLAGHAARAGITFLSTPFDGDSAEFLVSLGVPALKVSSGELTNLPLLAHLAQLGLPLMVSTGMASLGEVADALITIRGAGDPPIALLQCVSRYPAEVAESNLRAMETLAGAFRVPVGWSDHTLGVEASLAAAARGACVIEKHFTLDRSLPGPDHAASLEPGELASLVRGVRRVEAALGDGRKVPSAGELATAAAARRSLHAARSLAAGHLLVKGDLALLRPGTGLAPKRLRDVVGRRLARAVAAHQLLEEDDLV